MHHRERHTVKRKNVEQTVEGLLHREANHQHEQRYTHHVHQAIEEHHIVFYFGIVSRVLDKL